MIGDGWLRCSVADDEFAIRANDVRHVTRVDQLRHDESRDARVGIVKLGGQSVPVFALRTALGLSDRGDSLQGDHHIAVTGDNDELIGWIVDRLSRESDAGNTRVAPLPRSIGGHARRWFEGVVTWADGRSSLLVNPRHLNPLRPPVDDTEDAVGAIIPPPNANSAGAEPVALVFTTSALPTSPIDRFAVSGRQVAAIVHPTETIRVPGCAAHVAGVTRWRDAVVPIVDFCAASLSVDANRRRLIARCGAASGQSLIAIPIDEDVRMYRPSIEHQLIADIPRPPFSAGVFNLNGARVALLDLDALAKFGAGREN